MNSVDSCWYIYICRRMFFDTEYYCTFTNFHCKCITIKIMILKFHSSKINHLVHIFVKSISIFLDCNLTIFYVIPIKVNEVYFFADNQERPIHVFSFLFKKCVYNSIKQGFIVFGGSGIWLHSIYFNNIPFIIL